MTGWELIQSVRMIFNSCLMSSLVITVCMGILSIFLAKDQHLYLFILVACATVFTFIELTTLFILKYKFLHTLEGLAFVTDNTLVDKKD